MANLYNEKYNDESLRRRAHILYYLIGIKSHVWKHLGISTNTLDKILETKCPTDWQFKEIIADLEAIIAGVTIKKFFEEKNAFLGLKLLERLNADVWGVKAQGKLEVVDKFASMTPEQRKILQAKVITNESTSQTKNEVLRPAPEHEAELLEK